MKKQYIIPTTLCEAAFALSAIMSPSSTVDDESMIQGNFPHPGGSAPIRNTLIVK